jgi:hypothetical protein
VQWSAWVYAFLLLSGYWTWGLLQVPPQSRSLVAWSSTLVFEHLAAGLPSGPVADPQLSGGLDRNRDYLAENGRSDVKEPNFSIIFGLSLNQRDFGFVGKSKRCLILRQRARRLELHSVDGEDLNSDQDRASRGSVRADQLERQAEERVAALRNGG